MVNGKMIYAMEKGYISLVMVIYMKETIWMMNELDKVYYAIKMEKITQDAS